jgi:predicted amidophosphoribosyltransferase
VSPRIIDTDRCPHCGEELPEETPRVCPHCGGSLQQRYLQTGCLTSKPLLVLLAAGPLALLLRALFEAA